MKEDTFQFWDISETTLRSDPDIGMPEISWTTKVHQISILHLEPLLSSNLNLQLHDRRSRDGYLLWRETGLPRDCKAEAVLASFHWKDSRSSLCHISVSSQEEGHPESTRAWELSIQLRAVLPPERP